jgi:hypothetical protein
MDERIPPADDSDSGTKDDGTNSNVVLLVLFVVVVGTGIWLVSALLDARKADNCITQGRRDCAPITVPRP